MLLSEWMNEAPLKPEDLVAVLKSRGHDISKAMVNKVKSGLRRFSPEICREIVSISGGKVSLEELQFQNDFKRASNG